MNLSDNMDERQVFIGNSTGRAFTGTHGDGILTTTASFEGNATNTDWPGINGTTNKGVTAATGYCTYRGGAINTSALSISDRSSGIGSPAGARVYTLGARLARTAP
jgi:hypothetical protein